MALSKAQALKVLDEAKRRVKVKEGLNVDEICFKEQIAFIRDPAKFKSACCGRRSGKTHSVAIMLIEKALEFPGSSPLYITSAREKAKEILWPALRLINEQEDLGMDFKEHTGEIRFPNGSIIRLSGAGSYREIEKLRGPTYPIAVIDEAQMFTADLLRYLIEEILDPAITDYAGSIVLTGTPNATCAGFFYEVDNGIRPGWSTHGWTIHNNTEIFRRIPDKVKAAGGFEKYLEQDLERKRTQRGWTRTHPGYLREIMGKWARDSNESVFAIDREKCLVTGLVEDIQWLYVLGIDVGYNDPCAFVVLAYSMEIGECRVVNSYSVEGMIPSKVAAEIQKLQSQYPITAVVMDSGGIGKGYLEECNESFGLAVQPAKKTDRLAHIDFVNGDLQSGALKFDRNCVGLVEQMEILPWNPRKKEKGEYEFAAGYRDHEIDALLYGYRQCRHHGYFPHEERVRTRDEILEEEQRRMDEAELFPEDDGPWWNSLSSDFDCPF